jgi:putative DNA primase/helicase
MSRDVSGVPPQNLEAEQAVLGSMLRNSTTIPRVRELLRSEDFYHEAHRLIFETIAAMFGAGEGIDLITVTDRLRDTDQLDRVGGAAYVTGLLNTIPGAANAEYHVGIVLEKSLQRQERQIHADAEYRLQKGDDPQQVEARVRAALEEIAARRGGAPGHAAGPPQFHLTDLGNAQRLVLQHGQDLRYCHTLHAWFVWDGRRWKEDTTGEVSRRAKRTVAAMYAEAARTPDSESRKNLVTWAMRSEAADRIAAMMRLAESEPGVVVESEQLNSNPFLLTCLNGTIDLHTGTLQPHRREDLNTRLAPVEFDPNVQLDLWQQTLAFAFPDAEVRNFVQHAVGYSATGDICEEKFFMLIGPTNSGKTTFVEAIKAAMGDYAATADISSFLVTRDDHGPRNDIARLDGRRFIASVEVEQGKRLAEGLVKLLSGGDTVLARRLYQEHFEFKFTGKIWIVANHAPMVRDDDDALWRRIIRIPCQQIPEDRRDPKVKDLLRNPAVGGPAVLAWIVRGVLEWQQRGLAVPAAITAATAAYRQEMDVLQPFIESTCILDPPAWVEAGVLRAAYETWARENGERRPVGPHALGGRLRARGCHSEKRAHVRGWAGIALKDAAGDGRDGNSGNLPSIRGKDEVTGNDVPSVPSVPERSTLTQSPAESRPTGDSTIPADDGRRVVLLRLGENLGWPKYEFKPGTPIAKGEEHWRTFASTASSEDITLALRTLESYGGPGDA